MSVCKLVESKRGASVLIVDGYSYHINKKVNDTFYWRSTRSNAKTCGATVKTVFIGNEYSIINQNNAHGHLPEPEKRIQMEYKAKIRNIAKASMDSPAQIVNRCLQDVPSTSAAHLPNKAAARILVHRIRNKGLPKIPNTINFEIPDYLSKIGEEQFLIGQYLTQNESVVVFCTKSNLKRLITAKCWVMDGTFSTYLAPFSQIYTIHASIGTESGTKKFLPLVYALLSHKTETCYRILLELLKRYAVNTFQISLSPRNILSDFEIAAISAVKQQFPKCVQIQCLFHLTQSIWRHVQIEGLAKRYGNDFSLAHKIRHIICFGIPRSQRDT